MNPYPIGAEVIAERRRQVKKWGEQQHRDGTGAKYGYEAEAAKQKYAEEKAKYGDPSWRVILAEEVAEAFAEADLYRLRQELLQVAAVAVAWIEDIDRRMK